jgi:hypothetical protein
MNTRRDITSLTVKEIQIKMTQIPFHPNQNGYQQENNTGEDVGKRNPHTLLVEM